MLRGRGHGIGAPTDLVLKVARKQINIARSREEQDFYRSPRAAAVGRLLFQSRLERARAGKLLRVLPKIRLKNDFIHSRVFIVQRGVRFDGVYI